MSVAVPPSSAAVHEFVLRVILAFLLDRGAFAGQRLTSWHRDPEENERVGGVPDSQHLIGSAWDLAPGGGRLLLTLQAAGLEPIQFAAHLHVELRDTGA